MTLLVTLLALQAVATALGGALLWRKYERLREEVRGLRSQSLPIPQRKQLAPAQRQSHMLTADGWAGAAIALFAVAPALGTVLGAPVSALAAAGVSVGAALLAASFKTDLQRLAWPGVLAAAGWALVGFFFGVASVPFATALAAAGGVAVAHATWRSSWAGLAGAGVMAAAALALGAQDSMLSPAGAAFAVIVLCAAIGGALRVELEAMHLAAFGAALIGLLVLSGQDIAALWFTPAAALTGAAFFAIAAVRVPQLGERGVTLAGTGALAPLVATAALHISQHGLADRASAIGAFAALALLFGWLLSAAATRAGRSYASLRLTLWVLGFAIFAALIAMVAIAAHAPLAAAMTALGALFLVVIARRQKVQILLFFACAAAGLALVFALWSAQRLLGEAGAWPGYAALAVGAAAPAMILGLAALLARRAKLMATSAALEISAITLCVAALSLGLRLIAAQGAPLLHPLGFAEAGAHIALWLTCAFVLRRRARKGARAVRVAAAHALIHASVAGILMASVLWVAGVFPGGAALALLSRDTLGFALPAAGFFAHWALWRWRDIPYMARLCFGAATALTAAFGAAEISSMDSSESGLPSIAAAVLLFAGAAGLNFLPVIVRRRLERQRQRVEPVIARKKAA